MEDKILEVRNLSKSFNNKTVINDFSLELERGKVSCLLGPSGCGKSTFLRLIAGLETYDKGEINIRAGNLAFIFQEHRLLPWLTAYENVDLVLKNKVEEQCKRNEMVKDALHSVKLEGYADYYPDELSGGMKQRVAIARALAVKAELLLMDEPLSNLDFPLRLDLIHIFHDIFANNKSGIFVTHDTREALLLCDEILVLSKEGGQIKDSINIDMPGKERTLDSPYLFHLNKQLNQILLEDKFKDIHNRGFKKIKRRKRRFQSQ